jgi:hypothetical protein
VNASNAEHQRAWRERQRGGPPREPDPCGTLGAALRHQRAGEAMCDACRSTWNAYRRERRRAKG